MHSGSLDRHDLGLNSVKTVQSKHRHKKGNAHKEYIDQLKTRRQMIQNVLQNDEVESTEANEHKLVVNQIDQEIQLFNCVVKIQAFFRMKIQHRRYRDLLRKSDISTKLELERALRNMQQAVKLHQQKFDKDESAACIQRCFRKYRNRQRF